LTLQRGDGLRRVAQGRAAGAEGHGDVFGLVARQLRGGTVQLGALLFGLGGVELEADGGHDGCAVVWGGAVYRFIAMEGNMFVLRCLLDWVFLCFRELSLPVAATYFLL